METDKPFVFDSVCIRVHPWRVLFCGLLDIEVGNPAPRSTGVLGLVFFFIQGPQIKWPLPNGLPA